MHLLLKHNGKWLAKIIFIFVGLFVFQRSVIAAFANPVNLGFDPHSPIFETYSYGENGSLVWVEGGRSGKVNWHFSKSESGVKGKVLTRESREAARSSKWVFGSFKSSTKWADQLAKRGWTKKQITKAITKGKSFSAVNNVNKANSATRYVHPTTGQSVVIDDVTKELLHVGGLGFKY